MEVMNRHFALVGPKLAEKITLKPDDDCLCCITPESNVMVFKTINETHIHCVVKNLKNGKAESTDKIPTTINKDVAGLIKKPLTMIFNSSQTNRVFQIFGNLPELPLLSNQVQTMMSINIGLIQSSWFSQGSRRQ